jgi:hypothetical protein
MTEKIKIITLLKSGPGWLPEYVYRLHRAVDRHLNVPHEFICLTDIELGVRTLPLIPMPEIDDTDIPKFWYKVQLFRPELELTSGCIFLDLDTIIKGNIDHYIDTFRDHDFLMAASPYRGNISCSYFMWWSGDHSDIWNQFQEKPVTEWNQHYHKANPGKYGDQGFISDHVSHSLIQDVMGNSTTDIIRVTKNSSRGNDSARVIVFAGKRKPWDMPWHADVQDHWL